MSSATSIWPSMMPSTSQWAHITLPLIDPLGPTTKRPFVIMSPSKEPSTRMLLALRMLPSNCVPSTMRFTASVLGASMPMGDFLLPIICPKGTAG